MNRRHTREVTSIPPVVEGILMAILFAAQLFGPDRSGRVISVVRTP